MAYFSVREGVFCHSYIDEGNSFSSGLLLFLSPSSFLLLERVSESLTGTGTAKKKRRELRTKNRIKSRECTNWTTRNLTGSSGVGTHRYKW